jgi:hypothetical protein
LSASLPGWGHSITLLWLSAALSVPNACCQKTFERNGNIFVAEGGNTRQVTTGGLDHYPSIAPACAMVFFVRDFPQVPKQMAHSEIWSELLRDSAVPTPVYQGPLTVGGRTFREFWQPEVSADCRYVYFMFDFASTSHGIASFDRSDASTSFVTAGNEYKLALEGPYNGDLLVLQRRQKKEAGYDQVWVVFTPTGKEVKVLDKLAPGTP